MPDGVYKKVRLAHRARLMSLTGIPTTISWEGRPFTVPNTTTAWLRETLKPASAEPRTIGPRRRVRHRGLYLVDCFYPQDDVTSAAENMADAIVEHFYPGLQLSYDGQSVLIRSASRGGLLTRPDWRQVPVTISFEFHTLTAQ